MIFETVNSKYEVKKIKNGYNITKVEKINDSNYLNVGETMFSETIDIVVGERAYFGKGVDSWSTSEVVKIGNEE